MPDYETGVAVGIMIAAFATSLMLIGWLVVYTIINWSRSRRKEGDNRPSFAKMRRGRPAPKFGRILSGDPVEVP